MWNAVARLASPGGPRRASRSRQPPADLPLVKFTQAWEMLKLALNASGALSPAKADSISSLLAQLVSLLRQELRESQTPGSLGVCLEFVLEHHILADVVASTEKDEPRGVRILVIRFMADLVSIDQSILVHAAVNKPLIKLLRTCVDQQNELMRDEETAVVEVMCLVCCRLKTAPQLVPIFLRERAVPPAGKKKLPASLSAAMGSLVLDEESSTSRPLSPTASTSSHSHSRTFSVTSSSAARPRNQHDFLLFTYLLRFVHREGNVGDFAREGLLHLVDIATALPSSPSQSLAPSNTNLVGMTRSDTSTTITSITVTPTPSRAAREATLAFGDYLLDSDLAEVLGAGLGALYGLLPMKLVVRGPDSRTRAGEWDDEPGKVSQAGGMVLGGMGPLGEDDDPEEAERQREDEEDRLRGMGFGLTGTDEFREGLDGFLTLVEFAQEVLGRCKGVEDALQPEEGEDELEDEPRQQRSVMTALSASILTSLRSSLLENVVYPSVLECSEADGSAVAVMSYVQAMLDVIHEGTDLEAVVLGFLMGEEDARDLAQRQRMASLAGPRNASASMKKATSDALILLQNTSATLNGMRGDGSSSYYTSLGRFTLKDLLVSHVHSTSAPTATAALKLLHSVLVSHDRWSLGLLDIVLDESATSFPVPLREKIDEDDESDEDAPFVYPGAHDEIDDESDDEFVYPGASESKATLTPARAAATPSKVTTIAIGTPIAPTVSVKAHQSGLDALLSLVGNIDPAYRRSRSVGGASEILGTGFSNYLRDAEAAMTSDRAFRRGLAVGPGEGPEQAELPSIHRRRSTLFGPVSSELSPRELAAAHTMYKHRLKTDLGLTAVLLDSMSHFFSHSPDLNLQLTAVLATLALCPYRSLDGWLFPPAGRSAVPATLTEMVGKDRRQSMSDDGDDRSVDFDVEELAKSSPAAKATPPSWAQSSFLSSLTHSASSRPRVSDDSLLSILSALATSVAHYRGAINDFDQYLSERRQGLFFVENLTDALDLDVEDGNAFGDAIKNLQASAPLAPAPEPATPVKVPAAKAATGLGFGAFLSPKVNRVASSAFDAFLTPPRKSSQLSRTVSVESLQEGQQPSSSGWTRSSPTKGAKGPASPFAAHYQQTGSISVKPVIVSTPSALARGSVRAADLDDEGFGDESMVMDGGGPPDSPTKRMSPAPPLGSSRGAPSPSVASESGEGSDKAELKRREVKAVTLSVILDNVIVLEEFIKELAGIVSVRASLGIDAVALF